jgi:outer membrane protein OmpA-like peptidoglycan-associated protein
MGARAAGAAPKAMRNIRAALLGALLLTAACASAPKPQPASTPVPAPSRDVVVLLPDHQGKTGAIVVSGKGGERLLSKPGQAVGVPAGAAPEEPYVMTREELSLHVGPALSALPPPPLQFILYFKRDTVELTPASQETMRQLVRSIRNRPPLDISVVGHTDTVGTRSYNYRLSLQRAKAVSTLLTAEGVNRSLIEIASHGEDNPLVRTGDKVPEPRNRRVEVTVR